MRNETNKANCCGVTLSMGLLKNFCIIIIPRSERRGGSPQADGVGRPYKKIMQPQNTPSTYRQ